MHEQLRAIEDDFEKLAARLASLIDLYDGDPAAAAHVDSLRAALDKVTRGVELVRLYRQP